MPFEFHSPTRILFGAGAVNEVAPAAKTFGERVLLVAGREIARAQPVLDRLKAQGLTVACFSVAGEPTVDRVRAGLAYARAEGCEVVIGIVGKYVSFEDSYKSLNEALTHGGFANDVRVVRRWVEAEELERGNSAQKLQAVDGILVPGGFGPRGTGGMVAAAEHGRRTGTPYFGICYGFQWAVTACRLPTRQRSTPRPSTR